MSQLKLPVKLIVFRNDALRRRELAMPPTISLDQVTGFGIFMIRAVLSGRGDEIVDLARTNLWR